MFFQFTCQKNDRSYDAEKEDHAFLQSMLETPDAETIELHHTHMILFDDGELSGYIGDEQRRLFVEEASNNTNNCEKDTNVIK